MLRFKGAVTAAVLFSLALSSMAFASETVLETTASPSAETYTFTENNADMQVYQTDFDGLYNINMYGPNENLPYTFYEKSVDGSIYTLMLNGSFVPYSELLTSKGTVYISADKLSELIGNEADSSTFESNTYTFKKGEKTITISTNSTMAVINGTETDIGAFSSPLYAYNGKDEDIYVPVRPVIEALGGSVEYVADFEKTYANGKRGKYDAAVNIVIVEMPSEHDKVYTVEEGLNTITALSKETYESVKSYLTETGRTFSDTDPDYNPEDIKYIGDMGRYYVYHLKGFEELPIMVNKYTGEVFSSKPGLPFVHISKGFPNIGWLYQ